MQTIIPTRSALMQMIHETETSDTKQMQACLKTLMDALQRMAQVLELLRGAQTCFCASTPHSVACKKACECLDLMRNK